MEDISLINNTSVYRNPDERSPLQGPNVMQPAAVYSKIMLRTIELSEADYTFDKLAVERTMPSNNGANEIVFKRMLTLAAHTQPLVEGIPPASDQGRMIAIKGSTKSYGRVMKFTDKVNWAVVDPLISEYTRQLSMKIPETKDILAQEALLSESNVFYAHPKKAETHDSDRWIIDPSKPAITHITSLTTECQPNIDEFRQIVLSMEAAKVRPHSGGNFLALVSSAVMFDLITDKRVKEYMRYAGTGEAYKNDAVIDLFNLVFRKAKTIKQDNTFIDADGNLQFIWTCIATKQISFATADAGGATVTVNAGGSYNFIIAKDNDIEDKDSVKVCIGNVIYGFLGDTTKAVALTYGDVKGDIAGKLNVHHSFVLGEECLYRIGVEGHTAPQFIKKELGSAGTEDPLNQRQSIGWKIDSLGYKVIRPDAVVDYMCIPSNYRINTNERPDLKHQFTDYFYGYVDASGNYYYPEQVVETFDASGTIVYRVRGIGTVVTAIKMSQLVKPVNGGRLLSNGKKATYVGNVPTVQFALASNLAVRFVKDQIAKSDKDGKYYIKGLEGVEGAEVVKLPTVDTNGNIIEPNPDVNATGHKHIDDK